MDEEEEAKTGEGDSSSSSVPFWKREADRQHFESVKRILGLQSRDDDDDDESDDDEDSDEDDVYNWENLRQSAKSGQGWGRFQTEDSVER